MNIVIVIKSVLFLYFVNIVIVIKSVLSLLTTLNSQLGSHKNFNVSTWCSVGNPTKHASYLC